MTPQEHYAKAEELAVVAQDQVAQVADAGNTFTPDEMDSFTVNLIAITSRGNLHAKLAEVGLSFERAGFFRSTSPTLDSMPRAHDFPSGTPSDIGTGHNCRKCGRCEKHQGVECMGSLATREVKTCLVCMGGRPL